MVIHFNNPGRESNRAHGKESVQIIVKEIWERNNAIWEKGNSGIHVNEKRKWKRPTTSWDISNENWVNTDDHWLKN